ILFTQGIYLINETQAFYAKAISWYHEGQIKPVQYWQGFVDHIYLHPPINHESHHSVANEWSILSWAKTLDLHRDTPTLHRLQQQIEGLLYYKFLMEKRAEADIIQEEYFLIQ